MSDAEFDAAAWERALAPLAPLERALCPPREELAREPLPAALRRHVQACPGCRDDLRDLAALLAPQPATAGLAVRLRLWVDRVRRRVEALDPGGLLPAPAPALAALRGDDAGRGGARLIPFGDGALKLSYLPAPAGVDLELVAEGGAPREFRALLGPVGQPAWEGRTAVEGAVRLSGLAAGSYALEVLGPGARDPEVRLTLDLSEAAPEG
ncbi:MAG: hypothetical protein R3F62_07570 [Planctomycetota bacterium]